LLFEFKFLDGSTTSAFTLFKKTEFAAAFLLSYRLASQHHLVSFPILINLCGIPADYLFTVFTFW